MKAQEELNALKEEVETLNIKLHELTGEELEQVSGGETIVRATDPMGEGVAVECRATSKVLDEEERLNNAPKLCAVKESMGNSSFALN